VRVTLKSQIIGKIRGGGEMRRREGRREREERIGEGAEERERGGGREKKEGEGRGRYKKDTV
jgi:hypothetical protein